ncbi:hypothetical protein AMTR_s00211p00022800, partial [Amborella trichopoda]
MKQRTDENLGTPKRNCIIFLDDLVNKKNHATIAKHCKKMALAKKRCMVSEDLLKMKSMLLRPQKMISKASSSIEEFDSSKETGKCVSAIIIIDLLRNCKSDVSERENVKPAPMKK